MGEKGNDGATEGMDQGGAPRTQEGAGTGTTPPAKAGPSKVAGTEADHRATGQITDETGEYSDIETSDPTGQPDVRGWSSGELSDQPESWRRGHFPNEPPGGGRGQITDDSGGYGPERRSR